MERFSERVGSEVSRPAETAKCRSRGEYCRLVYLFVRLLYKIAMHRRSRTPRVELVRRAPLLALQSAAQAYPSKPVHVFVPSSPGGASDVAARLVAPKLAEALGQPFIVENRVASGGIVGTAQLAKSPADGYAIMMTFDTFASNPHLYKELPYDVVKDFAPVMLLTRYPQILVVHPSLKVKTVPEFVAYAKANGAKLNYGSAGPASSSRLAFELFKETAGIELEAVHYKGGGPAINDLLPGTVQEMLIQAGGAIGQKGRAGKAGGLRPRRRQRPPHFPGLPTIADFYPGFETTSRSEEHTSELQSPCNLA